MRKVASVLLAVLLVSGVVLAQKKKGKDSQTRSVEGVVTGANDAPVNGAVVQLKNTKSLEIRSYITQNGGKYQFYELSPDIDYQLKAEFSGMASGNKTLSSFDSRKSAIINLKLESKK